MSREPNPPGIPTTDGDPEPAPMDADLEREIWASLPVGVAIHRDGRLLYVNPAGFDLLGISAGEPLPDGVFEENDGPSDSEATVSRTVRVTPGEGVERFVEATSREVECGGRSAIRTILRDVTDAVRARRDLEESAHRYRTLFEESLDPIYVTETDGTLLEINRAGLELFGFSREEMLGLDVQELYEDPTDRSRFREKVEEYGEVEGFEVRLRTRDGDVLDCVLNATARYDPDGEIVGYQGLVRDVTERKRLEERLRIQALRDPLTELPNRALMWDRLRRAIARADRHEKTIAVLFLDVDRFKSVNDGLGHAAGDDILRQVATRLEHVTRETDTVARVGGDEFTILLEAARGPEEVDMVAGRIVSAFGDPFQTSGQPIRLSVSIGGTLRFPNAEDGLGPRPADELVRRADVAMYAAKERAGSAYVRYDPRHDPRQRDRLAREHALHAAIEQREFVLHYQPIVQMSTGRVGAVEALVRWSHPERGLLTPDQFLALAEDTGLIHVMGDWILETAFEDLSALTRALDEPDLALHLNLSPSQFEHPTGVERLSEILRRSDLTPDRVVLEVTEHAVLSDPSRAEQVRKLGVRLAVDDVGTGYSSLRYIKDLRADTLKIDGSFVRGLGEDPTDEAIVGAVVALGEPLGLDVVAEGVETEVQRQVARSLGCEWGQGHLFGRPMGVEDLPEWTRARSIA